MRISLLVLAMIVIGGCSGTRSVQGPAGAGPSHKTPVSRENPSMSQRQMYRRLQEGDQVTGRTNVDGDLRR